MNQTIQLRPERLPKTAKPANAVLKCLFPYRITHKAKSGAIIPFPARCGWCYACVKTKENDLMGRIGSEALLCTHVSFLTLTYDSKRGVEEAVSAKFRNVRHLQNFQKRLRQREARALKAYNKRELLEAQGEQREPRLVDTNRSYIKFVSVHEHGTKNTKRSHWHVMVLWLSHFDLDVETLMTGDLAQCMSANERVWDLPAKYGPRAKRRPAGAFDPDLIDYTVDKDANQEHSIWPHGQVNFKSCTHEVQHESCKPVLNGVRDLAGGIVYLNKYIRKNGDFPKGAPKLQQNWTKEQCAAYTSQRRRNVHKTMSMTIGHTFAYEWGKHHGQMGIPLHQMHYRLPGFVMKRKPESVHKFQQKMYKKGMSPASVAMLTDDRLTFEMRGSQARAAFRGFDAAPNADKVPEHRRGDAYLRAKMAQESDDMRKFLRSREATAIRAMATDLEKQTFLTDELTPVHCYETAQDGTLCDGTRSRGVTRETRFRKTGERLKERRQEIERVRRSYETALDGETRKMDVIKRVVGKSDPYDLLTEVQYCNRPKFTRERFRREIDAEHIEALRAELTDQIQELSNPEKSAEALAQLRWLDAELVTQERDAFELPRYHVAHLLVGPKLLLRWINNSDDYGFPDIREELILATCGVHWLSDDHRVIEAPDGSIHVQRRTFSPTPMKTDAQHQTIRTRSGFRKWYSRRCASDSEIEQAIEGKLPNNFPFSDPVFVGEQPFWVNPKMRGKKLCVDRDNCLRLAPKASGAVRPLPNELYEFVQGCRHTQLDEISEAYEFLRQERQHRAQRGAPLPVERNGGMIEYDHPEFREPQRQGPAMLARERALTRRNKAGKRPRKSRSS